MAVIEYDVYKQKLLALEPTLKELEQALNIPRDVRQVPKATSKSVIKSFRYVVCADVVLSIFYFVDYMNNISTII